MTCQSCADAVKNVLSSLPEIREVFVDLKNEQVVVETTLSCSRIQDLIESTGRKAVVRGIGIEKEMSSSALAAVAMMSGESGQQGIIRLVQSLDGPCLFDGTVDGLVEGTYAICVHEFGDVSQGCDSCGDILQSDEDVGVKYGELGHVEADEHGRAEFRIENVRVKIFDIIGRSVVIHQKVATDVKSIRVAWGIVARSSGIFENAKRICACDGLTLWDERSLRQKRGVKHDETV